MSETVKYFEIPPPKNGVNAVILYDENSCPEGYDIKRISSYKDKIPYVEGKGKAPYSFYPVFEETNK